MNISYFNFIGPLTDSEKVIKAISNLPEDTFKRNGAEGLKEGDKLEVRLRGEMIQIFPATKETVRIITLPPTSVNSHMNEEGAIRTIYNGTSYELRLTSPKE